MGENKRMPLKREQSTPLAHRISSNASLEPATQRVLRRPQLYHHAQLAPHSLSPTEIQSLQRTIGNHAVGQLLTDASDHQPTHDHIKQKVTGGVIQRKIIADGQPGAGRMEEPERGSFDGLLAHNMYDANCFFPHDYNQLAITFQTAQQQDAVIPNKTAKVKIQAKVKLKATYNKLIADIKTYYLKDGNPHWDAMVADGVRQYQASGNPNIDASYINVGTALWPQVGARGNMPDTFWQAIRKRARLAYGAALAGAGDLNAAETLALTTIKTSIDAAKTRWQNMTDDPTQPQVNAQGTYGTADIDNPWTLLSVNRKTFEVLLRWWTAKGANHTLGSSWTTGVALHVTTNTLGKSPKMIYHFTITA